MKKWKAIIGVILVFVLGAAAGSIVTHKVCQRRMESIVSGGPHAVRKIMLERMNRELKLDDNQRAQLEAIFTETHDQIRAAKKQVEPQIDSILDRAEDKVRAMLRPDQRERFEKFVIERKERTKKRREE